MLRLYRTRRVVPRFGLQPWRMCLKKRAMHCGRNHLAQAVLFAIMAAVAAQAVPRYRLAAGDHLVFERRITTAPLDATAQTGAVQQQLQYWVLAKASGRATLLAEMTDIVDGAGRTRGGLVFEIDERGRRTIPREYHDQLEELMPLLEPWPEFQDAFHSEGHWRCAPDEFGRVMESVVVDDASATVRVGFELNDPVDVAALLGQSARGDYAFDSIRGLVRRVESTAEDRRRNRREQIAVRLFLADRVSESWIRSVREEADRFSQTMRLQWQYVDRLTANPREADRATAHISRIWSELVVRMGKSDGSPVRRLVGRQRQWVQDQLQPWRTRALIALRWLGHQTERAGADSGGGAQAGADVGGRLMLEMYWSADEPDSVRMLGKLAWLHAAAGAGQLTIVCVNVDQDSAAAEVAAKICGANIVQLVSDWPLGGELAAPYPVWRLSDEQGKITRVGFNWWDTPDPLADVPD